MSRRGKRWTSGCLAFSMCFSQLLPFGISGGMTSWAAVDTGAETYYEAAIDMSERGSMALSAGSELTKAWNTVGEELIPGTTVIMGADGEVVSADITSTERMKSGTGQYSASGLRLGTDVSGVKSYFKMPQEIVCMGAGMEITGVQQGDLITVIDNVPITTNLQASLPNPWNGFRNILKASAAVDETLSWKSIIDNPTNGKHARNWIQASARTQPSNLEWSYLFGDSISKSNVWYRFNTKGTAKPALFELWMKPTDEKRYAYTLAAEHKRLTNESVAETQTKVLENTESLQAVCDAERGVVAVNKWTSGVQSLDNAVAKLTLAQPLSMVLDQDQDNGTLNVSVSRPMGIPVSQNIPITLGIGGEELIFVSNPEALITSTFGDGVYLELDPAKMGEEPIEIQIKIKKLIPEEGDHVVLYRGQQAKLQVPEDFVTPITWFSGFLKEDGTTVNNTGYSKIKRELKGDEKEGTRKAGPTTADHLLAVKSDGAAARTSTISAKEKGTVAVIATDAAGQKKVWDVQVLYENPANLPQAQPDDYAKIRTAWKENLIGTGPDDTEAGRETLRQLTEDAKLSWNTYEYKGMETCEDIPWPADAGTGSDSEIPFRDDAAKFRAIVNRVMAMDKAYATEGGELYKNQDLLKDMTNILDWFTTECYTPKSQTDNWWTWEIGIQKDLIPVLILLYDDLTPEQVSQYCKAMLFFQPDPFHEGAIRTASTTSGGNDGYRVAQGANLLDCSVTAMGLGALLNDNELVYLASKASSEECRINEVKDSTIISTNGLASGFYQDGSYLDHSRVPYLGSYGIEYYRGTVNIASMLGGTPWAYQGETLENIETYVLEGFGSGMYNGLMLEPLKGRAVARNGHDSRGSGRDVMALTLRLLDSLGEEAQAEIKSGLKLWIQEDDGFIESLTGVTNAAVKKKAQEIAEDDSIIAEVPPIHKNMAFMDRAIHRTGDYLFTLSMHSARIQNTEIMNGENLTGWHQGAGATYLYNQDNRQYTGAYWATVNPYRLAGTTVVPFHIGNGVPDSTGYLQEGDWTSKEHWVGGSSIGNYGINGMVLSGDVERTKLTYAPNMRAMKSYFMFEDEIVCLGSGITNSDMDLPVETTIENRHLNQDASNVVTVDGTTEEFQAERTNMEEIIDGTADTAGKTFEDVKWAHLDGEGENGGIGYYFPRENQSVQMRKTTNSGNWNLIGTTEGICEESYFEMWFDHGKNPSQASYEYVILPGKDVQQAEDYASHPQITVLSNTPEVQAVYSASTGMTGANFWKDEIHSVAGITANKKSSVMLEEKDGLLTIAVSDPTMKNTGTIVVDVERPVSELVFSDENVEAELTKQGVRLTIRMKGTNGSSSYAQVKLEASVFPNAATLVKGSGLDFEAADYERVMGECTWTVNGNQTELSKKTRIDSEGSLIVDEMEENGSLTVTVVSEDGNKILSVPISLGGDMAVEIPADIKRLEKLLDHVMAEAAQGDLADAELRQSVKAAVRSIRAASNEDLKKYLMDKVMKMEELYMAVEAANEREIGSYVEYADTDSRSVQIERVRGAALNIPAQTASPSNAVLEVRMTTLSKEDGEPVASPSNGTRERKASPSEAEESERAADETVVMEFSLYLETEDGQRRLKTDFAAPLIITMKIPEHWDREKDILVLFKGSGRGQQALSFVVNDSNDTITYSMTEPGYVILKQVGTEADS